MRRRSLLVGFCSGSSFRGDIGLIDTDALPAMADEWLRARKFFDVFKIGSYVRYEHAHCDDRVDSEQKLQLFQAVSKRLLT